MHPAFRLLSWELSDFLALGYAQSTGVRHSVPHGWDWSLSWQSVTKQPGSPLSSHRALAKALPVSPPAHAHGHANCQPPDGRDANSSPCSSLRVTDPGLWCIYWMALEGARKTTMELHFLLNFVLMKLYKISLGNIFCFLVFFFLPHRPHLRTTSV